MCVGVVRLEADAPHLVNGTGFDGKLTTSVHKVAFYRRVLRRVGESSCENGLFAFTLPTGVVQFTNAAVDAFVRLGIRRAQYEFQCTVVVDEVRLFSPSYTAQRRNTKHCRRQTLTVPIC